MKENWMENYHRRKATIQRASQCRSFMYEGSQRENCEGTHSGKEKKGASTTVISEQSFSVEENMVHSLQWGCEELEE